MINYDGNLLVKVTKMLKYTFFLFLSILFQLCGDSTVITLEHAWTTEQINWGLMQRKSLPENHGMLFHYNKPCTPTFWSFNCWIDLSVAFIDSNKIIREIKPLYAHPEKMDPDRPVTRQQDMLQYSQDEPIIQYFIENAACCKTPIQYVLEMNAGWFEKNNVQVGDIMVWDMSTHTAVFKHKTEFSTPKIN